jgi:general secretion pathway protein A
MTYYEHFGLCGPPFRFDASPRALFTGRTHREALAALEWGFSHEPSGFTLLVGEPGTGKSTLACALMMRKYQNVRAAYVPNPRVGFDGALREILRQLGVTRPTAYRGAAIEALNTLLWTLNSGERVVAIFDEAQGLSDHDLEELRMLASCGRADERQLHFVLLGTMDLLDRLTRPAMQSLSDRIGARAVLRSLDRAESIEYVEHRLRSLRGDPTRIFSRRTLGCLVDHSGGVPRRINVLCHNAMLMAFAAGVTRVTMSQARAAIAEYAPSKPQLAASSPEANKFSKVRRRWFERFRRPAAVFAMLWVVAMGAAYCWNFRDSLSRWLNEQMNLAVQQIDQLSGAGSPGADRNPNQFENSGLPASRSPSQE